MCQMLFLFLSLGQFIEFHSPKPVSPANLKVEGNSLVYAGSGWLLGLHPMTWESFQKYLLDSGVSQKVLDKPGVKKLLAKVAPFQVELKNSGVETLSFNPDQIMIRSSRGPDGYIIDMAQYWPTELPKGKEEQEQFARVFSRRTIELKPGQSHRQLIVFHPYSDKFRKKVNIQISRIYYGIDSFELECRYQVRSPKK